MYLNVKSISNSFFFKALVFCMFLMEFVVNVMLTSLTSLIQEVRDLRQKQPFDLKTKREVSNLRLVQFFTQQTLVAAGVVVTCRFPRSLHLSQMPEV